MRRPPKSSNCKESPVFVIDTTASGKESEFCFKEWIETSIAKSVKILKVANLPEDFE